MWETSFQWDLGTCFGGGGLENHCIFCRAGGVSEEEAYSGLGKKLAIISPLPLGHFYVIQCAPAPAQSYWAGAFHMSSCHHISAHVIMLSRVIGPEKLAGRGFLKGKGLFKVGKERMRTYTGQASSHVIQSSHAKNCIQKLNKKLAIVLCFLMTKF